MKKFLPLVIIYMNVFFCTSQVKSIDSLHNLLLEKQPDSLLLTVYYEIATQYLKTDIEHASLYVDTLYLKAKQMNLPQFELTALSQKGIIEFRKGNFQNAIDVWRNALNHKEIDHFPKQHGNLLNNIAIGFKTQNQKDSVINYLEKSILINEQERNYDALIANYYSISDYYFNIQDNDNALRYIRMLQKISIETNKYEALGRTYILLGAISRREFDFNRSVYFFKKALNIYKENDSTNTLMKRSLLYELAVSLISGKEYDEAIEYLNKIEKEFYLNDNNSTYYFLVKARLLWCYIQKEYFEKAELVYQSLLKYNISESTTNDAVILFNLSNFEIETKKITPQTKYRLETAYKLINKSNDYTLKKEIKEAISKYYISLGDYKMASETLISAIVLSDSLNNIETKSINLSLNRRFNEALKDKQLAEKVAENKQQEIEKQNLWITLLIIFAVLIGVKLRLRSLIMCFTFLKKISRFTPLKILKLYVI